ncbi:hypothetical protein CLAIMM_07410 [Cladophialophora immunda]|nr:hypothetical protein CLAIMM_07410 [Cladophialophora immunda]
MALEKEIIVPQHTEDRAIDGDVKSESDNVDDDPVYSLREQRKIIHRVDRRLISMLGLIHIVSLVDRGNLGAASIAGMQKDLKLVGSQYSIIALMFFPTYVAFQPIATVVFRKIGTIYFLSGVTFLWGVVMMCGGFVNDWTQLIGIRLLIGILEAGMFPGCVYLISTWYSRYDIHKRFAVFYLGGTAGIEGWRWIFIMEGLITIVVGIVSYFVLVDFPDKMKSSKRRFLSPAEYDFILRRIDKDRADSQADKFSLKKYLSAATDLKIYAFGLIFYACTTAAYSYAYFLPIIFQEGMGFSTSVSLCLNSPPYVLAGIVMLGTAWAGDKYHVRGPILVFNACLCLVGLPLMAFTENNASRLVGVFLAVSGTNANVPAAMAYMANNIRGQWKRAFCSAVFVMLGGTGGITGSTVFRSQDAPEYHPGMITCIAANGMIILLVILLSIHFRICNGKADQNRILIENLVGFRYTY